MSSAAGASPPTRLSRYGFPPVVMVLLGLAGLFETVDRIVFSTGNEAIRHALHLSDASLGLLGGTASALLNGVALLPLAALADRGFAARLVAAGLMLASIGTAAAGAARGFGTLALARVTFGLGGAAATPAVSALTAAYTAPDRRATGFSLSGGVSTAGYVIGFAGGGWAVEHLGWRATFAVVGLAGVAVAILLGTGVREPGARTAAAGGAAAWRALGRNRALRDLVLFGATNALTDFAWDLWISSFYQRSFGLTAEGAGAVLGFGFAVPAVLGTLAGGWLADRRARAGQALATSVRFAFLTFLLAWPFGVAQVFAHSLPVSVAMLVINNFVAMLPVGPLAAAIPTVVGVGQRAMATAVVALCCVVAGAGIGPPLFGWVSDLLRPAYGEQSLRMSLLLASVLGLWPAFHLWRLQRRLRATAA